MFLHVLTRAFDKVIYLHSGFTPPVQIIYYSDEHFPNSMDRRSHSCGTNVSIISSVAFRVSNHIQKYLFMCKFMTKVYAIVKPLS